MGKAISIVIPAWNEEIRITETLSALQDLADTYSAEIIVVDDGSRDATFQQAMRWKARVIRHPWNMGKGRAMETGWQASRGDILLFLDADLGTSAAFAWKLLDPVLAGEADMTIAVLPPAERKGGFGLVKGLASAGVRMLAGFDSRAPLSGQRAVRRQVLEQVGGFSRGFGIEVGLTIDAARKGFVIQELAVPFRHRESGRDWQGVVHRGRQLIHVGRTLLDKWREPV